MSKRILTDKEYIEGLADRCIWCKSEDINSGTAEFNEAEAYRLIRCSNCHKEWEEIFTITSTQEKGGYTMLTKKEGKHFIKGAIICGEVPWNDFLTGSEWNKIDEYIHNHSDKKSKKFMKKILKKYISYGENFKWRLPTKKELKEAYKNKTKGFRLNRYWSSTTDASSTLGAWYVNFQNGNAYYGNKYSGFFIRCVRNTKDGLKWNKSSVSEMDHCKAEEFIDFLNTQKH